MAPAGTAVSALPVVPAAPEEMPIKIILLGATPPGAMVVPAACYSAPAAPAAPARTAQRPVATVGRAVSPGCSATAATVVTPELARPRATSAPAAPAACCSARTA